VIESVLKIVKAVVLAYESGIAVPGSA
jgi:hypothetical protein